MNETTNPNNDAVGVGCDALLDDLRLSQLTPEQFNQVSLGLTMGYEFRVYIRGGRFWLEHVEKGGALMLRPRQKVAELFDTARKADELIQSLSSNAKADPST